MEDIAAAMERLKQLPAPWRILQMYHRDRQAERLSLTRESADQALLALETCLSALAEIPWPKTLQLPGDLGEGLWAYAGVAALEMKVFQNYDSALLRRTMEEKAHVTLTEEQFRRAENTWLLDEADAIVGSILNWMSDSYFAMVKLGQNPSACVDLIRFEAIVEKYWSVTPLHAQDLIHRFVRYAKEKSLPLLERLLNTVNDPDLKADVLTCFYKARYFNRSSDGS